MERQERVAQTMGGVSCPEGRSERDAGKKGTHYKFPEAGGSGVKFLLRQRVSALSGAGC